jgi:leader peptidase (prepilin peptidase) / N-methyltransferase
MLARWSSLNWRTVAVFGTPDAVATGIAAAASVAASLILVPGMRGAAGAGLALLMVAIAAIDARRFIIPDELSAATLALGLVHAALQADDAIAAALGLAALRGAALGLAFWSLRLLYRRLRGQEGLGLGDVKLACVAGVWLDWVAIPVAIELAALSAIAVCVVRYFRDGRSFRATTKLPFGLFFAPAIWLAWLLGATLLAEPAGLFP